MKLLHLANHDSPNIGNGALILGTERVLKEDFQGELIFIPEHWQLYSSGDKKFDSAFVDLVNRESNGLLVGAAVSLSAHGTYKNTGMAFNLPLDLWSKITRPLVFYAISYRSWPYMKYVSERELKRTMDYILHNPRILFSVRNDGTKSWLESMLGRASEKIIVAPDPTLYVPTTDAWHPEIIEGKVNVLISLNSEDEQRRFNGTSAERESRYSLPYGRDHLLHLWKNIPSWRRRKALFLKNLAWVLNELSKDLDINIILCPHGNEDQKMGVELSAVCSRRVSYLLTSSSHLRNQRAPYFYDLYTKADVVLSMRIHSMVPAVGLGAPLVALVSQSRMSEFMADAGLDEFCADISDPDLNKNLYKLIINILNSRNRVKEKLQAARSAMRKRTSEFNQRVFSFLGQNNS